MKKCYLALFMCLMSVAVMAETIMDEILNIAAEENKLIKIETQSPVSINVEIITNDMMKAFECRSCIELSHKMLDGHIAQKNASNIGVGFIEVHPEKGIIQVIVSHKHSDVKKVKIIVTEK